MLKTALLAALALACLASTADARPAGACVPTADVMRPCGYQPDFLAGVKSIHVTMKRVKRSAAIEGGAIVAHPSGCPHRAFCGCGAALRVFGSPIRDLWLAANWFRFPRTQAAPGMVAVRRHHVFVLEAHLSGQTWLAYDANSGRHATRIHPRSIQGYAIVNPHGAS